LRLERHAHLHIDRYDAGLRLDIQTFTIDLRNATANQSKPGTGYDRIEPDRIAFEVVLLHPVLLVVMPGEQSCAASMSFLN
jgi:hypothetical protein